MPDDQTTQRPGSSEIKASSPSSSFLGGGPKFNQAGFNAPLPGEKVADVVPQAQTKRIWIGAILAVVLIATLYVLYIHQPGSQHTGRGVSMSDRPSDNPDAPASTDDQ